MSSLSLPDADEVRDLVVAAIQAATAGTGLAADYDEKAKAAAGKQQSDLLLRAAPGSFVTPTQPYTHAVLSRSGAFDLEAHVGVKIRRHSDVLHEADLLLLPRAVGGDLSQRQHAAGGPPVDRPT